MENYQVQDSMFPFLTQINTNYVTRKISYFHKRLVKLLTHNQKESRGIRLYPCCRSIQENITLEYFGVALLVFIEALSFSVRLNAGRWYRKTIAGTNFQKLRSGSGQKEDNGNIYKFMDDNAPVHEGTPTEDYVGQNGNTKDVTVVYINRTWIQ